MEQSRDFSLRKKNDMTNKRYRNLTYEKEKSVLLKCHLTAAISTENCFFCEIGGGKEASTSMNRLNNRNSSSIFHLRRLRRSKNQYINILPVKHHRGLCCLPIHIFFMNPSSRYRSLVLRVGAIDSGVLAYTLMNAKQKYKTARKLKERVLTCNIVIFERFPYAKTAIGSARPHSQSEIAREI